MFVELSPVLADHASRQSSQAPVDCTWQEGMESVSVVTATAYVGLKVKVSLHSIIQPVNVQWAICKVRLAKSSQFLIVARGEATRRWTNYTPADI